MAEHAGYGFIKEGGLVLCPFCTSPGLLVKKGGEKDMFVAPDTPEAYHNFVYRRSDGYWCCLRCYDRR